MFERIWEKGGIFRIALIFSTALMLGGAFSIWLYQIALPVIIQGQATLEIENELLESSLEKSNTEKILLQEELKEIASDNNSLNSEIREMEGELIDALKSLKIISGLIFSHKNELAKDHPTMSEIQIINSELIQVAEGLKNGPLSKEMTHNINKAVAGRGFGDYLFTLYPRDSTLGPFFTSIKLRVVKGQSSHLHSNTIIVPDSMSYDNRALLKKLVEAETGEVFIVYDRGYLEKGSVTIHH